MAPRNDAGNGAAAFFAAELRRARAAAGPSQQQLASKIAYSPATVAAVETCRRLPTSDFARRCDDALGTGGLLARIQEDLVAHGGMPGWVREWLEAEREAATLRWWEPLLIPGLLQTEDYAREVLRAGQPWDSAEQIEKALATRMRRQEILAGKCAPFLWVLLDEGALRRHVGSGATMRGELARLLELAASPAVQIQIVPLTAGAHAGLAGPFVIASFVDGPDVIYLDTALSGQIVERSHDVHRVRLLYDTMRMEALPRQPSLDLISQEMDSWT
jgi:transcriptional regulator with XRE-family HTH domain